MSSTRGRIRLGILIATVLAGLVIAGAGPVSAHAVLLDSTPIDGATSLGAPTQVRLHFDEDVDVTSTVFRLFDAKGHVVALGASTAPEHPGANAAEVVAVQVPQLTQGRYLIRWQTITSDDFHPVTGSITFGVGERVESAGSDFGRGLGTAAETALRWLVLSGISLVAGGWALLLLLRRSLLERQAASRPLLVGITVGCVVAALGLVGLGWQLIRQSGLAPPTAFTLYWALAVLGVLIGMSTAREALRAGVSSSSLVPGVAGVVVGAWAVGHLGHGSAVAGSFVATLHVLATGVWVGGAVLITALCISAIRAQETSWARTILARFAVVAVPALLVSFMTGLLLARSLVPTQNGLTDTGYGRSLIAKGLLACVAVVLGGWTAWRARSGWSAGPGVVRLLTETGVLAVVLVLAAALSGGQPPDDRHWFPTPTTAATAGMLTADADDLLITMSMTPAQPGANFVTVGSLDTRRPAPAPIAVVLVGVAGGKLLAASRQNGTDWLVSLTLAQAGPVQFRVIVQRPGYADATAVFAWQMAPIPGTEVGGEDLAGWWLGLAGVVGAVGGGCAVAAWRRRKSESMIEAVRDCTVASEPSGRR